MTVPSLPSSGTLGSDYSFTVQVTIADQELLPIQSVNLYIYKSDDRATYEATCTNLPLTATTKSYTSDQTNGGAVTVTSTVSNWASGYGYGYAVWEPTGEAYYFGYGYGYGYGAGAASITYSVTWTSPSAWPTGGYKVETKVTANDTTFTKTSSEFTLSAPPITVISPNGGEEWAVGSSKTITWSSVGVTGFVKIQLSRDGGATWKTIIYGTPNDGSQAWTVTGPASTQARIKVLSILTPTVFDISDENFTIVQSITVISPNGGQNWAAGTSQTITWDSVGVTGFVRIQLSRDGGATWKTIIYGTPNDGSQAWTVTGPATTQARIKVLSILVPTVFDISDENFTISP